MPEIKETTHLKDLWNEADAQKMSGNQLALLRYRSNLLGADLRITNFGGGQHQLKVRTSRSVYWPARPRVSCKRQWRRSRFHHRCRICPALPRSSGATQRVISRRTVRG